MNCGSLHRDMELVWIHWIKEQVGIQQVRKSGPPDSKGSFPMCDPE
jgi:hypothetical protein